MFVRVRVAGVTRRDSGPSGERNAESAGDRGFAMRTCGIPLPEHTAQFDEIMGVLWSDYYGAALLGDEG